MQATMLFRVFAMYQRSLRIVVFILGVYACQIIMVLFLLALFYRPLSDGRVHTAAFCVLISAHPYLFAYWVPLIATDAMLLVFVAVAGLRRAWSIPASENCTSTNSMWNTLVYDTAVYFSLTITMYTINAILWAKLPTPWIEVPAHFAVSTVVTLGCRLVLNLRHVYYLPFADDPEDTMIPIQILRPRMSMSSVRPSALLRSPRESGISLRIRERVDELVPG
ncbi:hypothetical protein HGRIS_009926 [Hohenbuehelia grisea]|uniref:Integral membrane protein n=1 Tax=Hohenbuehelia grisea TaxID=104357 RepID=A0ABR3J2X5_9AGAR